MSLPAINLRVMILVPALVAGVQVQAQDTRTPLTREQVQAEFVRAQRAGELLAPGESAVAQKPAEVTASTASTIEVRGTLPRDARRGTLMAAGERGQLIDEGGGWVGAFKERLQVVAEFFEALRTGNVLVAGELGATKRELAPLAYPPQQTTIASLQ
jgi:hypothetical protein